jgi:hypothetical protein
MAFPSPSVSSNTELTKLGTQAIANCRPTNAIINLSSSLAEILREGVPRLPFQDWMKGAADERARLAKQAVEPKNLADEHLNQQFGWVPIRSDIENVAGQIGGMESLIDQYIRDAGRVVRRKWRFPEKRSVTTLQYTDFASGYYAPQDSWLNRPGRSFTMSQVDESVINTWFSGAFTYHLPADFPSREEMRTAWGKLSAVFDTDLTAETAWNITPWSWAVDWFSSTGDLIGNLTSWSKDGLVMRWGYLMQHSLQRRTYTLLEPRPLKGMPSDVNPSLTFVTETKLRKRANPYGFGLSWDGLTTTQQAILAALGISRHK